MPAPLVIPSHLTGGQTVRAVLARRVGRRGAALLFFGLLDLVYAYSLAFPTQEARHTATLAYIAYVAPLWAWALLWGAVGVICFVGALRRRDRVAFAAAMGLKVLFGVTMLSGWLVAGLDRAYVGAVLWLVLAGWVYILSTWPEPHEIDPTWEDDADGGAA
jgi:hypothetical protein